MSRILIIEDEKVIRMAVRRMLERNGYEVEEAGSVVEAEQLGADDFDLILADLRLPGAPGTDIIAKSADVPVVIMTSYASVRSAVESMKQGAADYISKPFDHDEMLMLVERVLGQFRLQRQNAALKQDLNRDYPVGGMIGACDAMQAVFERIAKVAPTDMTVLVLGESGTGKELVARALHEQSQRCESPLIAVNCAAIPEGLIESELFGHEKGAFTGAVQSRKGLIEAANGGTLFLDEVGELPASVQVRLLRVLEDNQVRPVGASRARHVNVRLVAATHRDLAQLVEQQAFRDDLYYRLRVMEIRLPPLRERESDIARLAQAMLEKACRAMNLQALQFTVEALDAMHAYHWPGNVRELQNAVERAAILAENNEVSSYNLGIAARPAESGDASGSGFDWSLDEYFRASVLAHQDQLTETEIARKLGISRKSLWQRRQRMSIPRPG